jgi:uncharacterized protein (TIGR00251 family)
MDGPVATRDDEVHITVWVVPGAKRTEIAGVYGDAIRIRVAQPPERGKANAAVVRLLEGRLDAEVELAAGAGSRRKRLVVRGVSADQILESLGL